MDRLTLLKVALAIAGLVVFLYGASTDQPPVRWTGIGFVVVAFVMRFFTKRTPKR